MSEMVSGEGRKKCGGEDSVLAEGKPTAPSSPPGHTATVPSLGVPSSPTALTPGGGCTTSGASPMSTMQIHRLSSGFADLGKSKFVVHFPQDLSADEQDLHC